MKQRMGLWGLSKVLLGLAPRRWWWCGGLLATLTVLMGMGLLGLSGWFITAAAIAGLVPATALVFDVFMPSAGIRLLAMGRTASRYAERLVTHDVTLAVLAALREKLFIAWAQPHWARQLQMQPARLLQRLTADVDALESLYLRLWVPLAAAVGAALLVGALLAALAGWLGMAVLLWLCVAAGVLTGWLVRRSHAPALQRAVALERLRSQAVDVVAGQTELLMADRLPQACQRLMALDAQVAKADHGLNRLDARAATGFGVAGAVTLAGVLGAAGWLVDAGHLSAPGAALALLLVLTAMEPFAALRRGAIEAGRTRLAARRLGAQLQAGSPAGQALMEGAQALPAQQALVLDDAWVHHASSAVPALRQVSLHIASGQHVALIGPSGAGKSTLLEVLAGELPLTQGRALLRPSVWLTQRIALFQDTVRGNLCLADPFAEDALLWSVLEDAGLAADVRAMPQGLDTWLGEGGLGLSVGQARRLGLARLFLSNQPCWLLDEPTEGLDASTARDVLQRLFARAASKTVVLSTHLQREALMADTVIPVFTGTVQAQAKRGDAAYDTWIVSLRPD